MKKRLLLSLFLFCSTFIFAQIKPTYIKVKKKIVCYAQDVSQGTRIYPRTIKNNKNAKLQQANIEVTYHGFTTQAQAAFQHAVDIWEDHITSPVVIHIDATWQSLDEGVLGSAIYGGVIGNFEGAKERDTFYPIALAEKMAGEDLNDPSVPDIVANFSSTANWYLGTDGNPGSSQYDLVSVVLHEIGHGLGFVDSFDYNPNTDQGSFGAFDTSVPMVYDNSVKNGSGEFLTTFSNPSTSLGSELVNDNLFFNSPTTQTLVGTTPKLYAPVDWSGGSSIAHLDETTYPAGNPNSLMTPQIGMDEVMHDPGPIMLNMFGDMGWEYTYINHNRLPNSEDIAATSFTVTTSITSDINYKTDSVRLFYSNDGFQSDSHNVFMSATGNPDEYTADIPGAMTADQTYSYYITVPDQNSRDFFKPSLAPDVFYTFTTSTDTQAPEISHSKPAYVRNSADQLTLQATVKDFLPLASVNVEYAINDQSTQMVAMTLVDELDSIYEASIDLSGVSLQEGDSIKYKIVATDQAVSSNESSFPASGLLKVDVLALAPAVDEYQNDFNDIVAAADDFFSSSNFSIREESGFNNGAIHSDHPYLNGTGAGDSSIYLYELRVPVTLSETEATMSFDEVALIEPGEPGTTFGSSQFWDYVVVQGSNNGGATWQNLTPGYDSRANSDWLKIYNDDIDGDNLSLGLGHDSLFVKRTIDLYENTSFSAGDEVLFRFKLYADQAAHGWGWAIDNLKIQIDETPPVIKHNHLDYVTSNENILLEAIITDNVGVDSVAFVDDQNNLLAFFPPNQAGGYNLNLDISTLNVDDTIKYQIQAYDTSDPVNVAYLPAENQYFEIPYIEFDNPTNGYSNDFDSNQNDFVGNFFEISQPAGFDNMAVHTSHPYPTGFGLEGPSDFTYTLKTPIIVDEVNHYLAFDHVFLGEINSDVVSVQASKDMGQTWTDLEEYNSTTNSSWASAQNNGQDGNSNLYAYRIVNITKSGDFKSGDELLIRFKLTSQEETSGWGWSLDNLEIQTDQITALPDEISALEIKVFPNPVESERLNVQLNTSGPVKNGTISIINSNAQVVRKIDLSDSLTAQETQIDISRLPKGLYLVKINVDNKAFLRKIIKL